MKLCMLTLALMAAVPLEAREPAPPPASDAVDMPLSHTVRHYKDWQIEQSSAFVAALTFNKSGSLFGLLCGKTCSYYVGAPTSCDLGEVYPGLLTSPGGAIALTLRCVHVREEGVEEEFLLIDEDLTEAFGEKGEIVIVVPIEGGQFNVSHFSLAGAIAARRDMLEIADKEVGPSDFIL